MSSLRNDSKNIVIAVAEGAQGGRTECAKDLPEAIRFWNSAFLTTKGFSPLYKLFLESTQGAKATLLLEMLAIHGKVTRGSETTEAIQRVDYFRLRLRNDDIKKIVIASFRKKAWQSTINKKNREHLTTSSTLILFLQNIKSITTNYKAYLRKSEVSSIF